MEISPFIFSALLSFIILTSATVFTFIMQKIKPDNATFKKVSTIVKSWWIIIGVFLTSLAAGHWGVWVLFLFLGLYSIKEHLTHSKLSDKWILGLILSSIILILYSIIALGNERLFLIFLPLALAIYTPLILIITRSVATLPFTFSTTTGLVLINFFLSHIPALIFFHTEIWDYQGQSIIAIVCLFLLTELNDVFQFICGKLFGKNHLVPEISPNKTEAGFLGGLVLTPLLAALCLTNLLKLTLYQSLFVGLSISAMGILGDLLFSTVKRYFQTKDFSHLLPGHGGILDRIDSLILTAPIYYYLIIYLKGGN